MTELGDSERREGAAEARRAADSHARTGTDGCSGVGRLPAWRDDKIAICDRIRSQRSPMKILLKQKNETVHLREWINHHSNIVGANNIIIGDNESTVFDTKKILESAKHDAVVFTFHGYHNNFHDRGAFTELYEAVCASCDFFMVLDSDERLVWIDGNRWYSGEDLIGLIASRAPFDLLPGNLIWNEVRSADRFRYGERDGSDGNIISWGKTLISSSAVIGIGHKCHNVQFPPGLFSGRYPNNLFQLHLSNLYPDERIRANVEKLVSWGFADAGESLEAILSRALPANHPGHGVLYRLLKEIRELRATPASERAGALSKGSIRLLDNGLIEFADDEQRDRFRRFVENGSRTLLEIMAPRA